jgi:PST family polysaccharide transporter
MLSRLRDVLARRHNVRAHFWQTAANYFQQATGLVLGILLARLLTPEIFGEFAYIAAVVGLFLLPASWSLSPQIVAESRSHPLIVSDALWLSRKVLFWRMIAATLACVYIGWTAGSKGACVALIISIPLVAGETLAVLRALLEGHGQFKVNFLDSLLTAGLTATIALPAAWFGAGIWSLALPAVPLFLAQAWLFVWHTGCHPFRPTAPRSSRSYFKSGSALWISGICEGALLRLDKFLLGKFSTFESLGDYNRASNYAPLGARILNSLLTNPAVAALTHASGPEARRALIIKSGAMLLIGSFVNFAIFWWFSDPLVTWIFGPQWESAIPVFEAMATLSVAISIGYLPTAVAIAKRAYSHMAIVRAVTLVAFLAAALMLGSRMTAVSMAWLLQLTLVVQGLLLSLTLWLQPSFSSSEKSHQ